VTRDKQTLTYFRTREQVLERELVDLGGTPIPMRPKNNSGRWQYFFPLMVCVVCLSCVLSPGQQVDRETDPSPDAPKPSIAESKGFFARWAEFYRQDWWGTTASSPAPERRGLPSPLDSPPFPNARRITTRS